MTNLTPEKVEELGAKLAEEIQRTTPPDELRRQVLAFVAGDEFSLEGFEAYFELIFGHKLLPYMKEAVKELFESHAIVVEAYFESGKTVSLSKGFWSYFIGHHPETTNMLVQVSDSKGEKTAESVADIIKYNVGWKMAFPHIIPDKNKSWGVESGYEIVKTHTDRSLVEAIPYEEWSKIKADISDPSFIGLGYKSGSIIGARITGMLLIDDIHDETNTFSQRALEGTITRLTNTILSRATKTAWRVVVGTPWIEGDTIHTIKEMGLYSHISVPVYEEVDEDTPGSFYWEEAASYVLPAWPGQFDLAYLHQKFKELGQADFARSMLLDLSQIGDRVFYFQDFDHEKVVPGWPTAGGVDFASILKESQRNDPNRAFFAQAYVAKLPNGGAVVTGGVRGRWTPTEAEEQMERSQNSHNNWLGTAVEQDGKGEVFIFGLMQRKQDLLFSPMKTRGRGKEKRLEREMSPWFNNGTVKVSTADTPFLNALRKELRDYPYSKYVDCLDAVYWALRMMPDILVLQKEPENLPRIMQEQKKKSHPYRAFGRT